MVKSVKTQKTSASDKENASNTPTAKGKPMRRLKMRRCPTCARDFSTRNFT